MTSSDPYLPGPETPVGFPPGLPPRVRMGPTPTPRRRLLAVPARALAVDSGNRRLRRSLAALLLRRAARLCFVVQGLHDPQRRAPGGEPG